LSNATGSDTLHAIRALNAMLALGAAGLAAAQRWGRVIQRAQEEQRPISAAEWDAIRAAADRSDARLAQAIQDAREQ